MFGTPVVRFAGAFVLAFSCAASTAAAPPARLSGSRGTVVPRPDDPRLIRGAYVPGELILRLAADTPLTATVASDGSVRIGLAGPDRLNREHRVTRMEPVFTTPRARLALPNVFKLTVPGDTDIPAVVRQYARDPAVLYAEPNHLYEMSLVPDDPDFFRQWALSQPSDHDIDAPEAWDIVNGSPNVVIAVLDTGVQWDHPDLAGNIWMNRGERLDGEDTDGNGFVDDIRGWDFVDTSQTVAAGEDGTLRDNDPSDFYGHGTLCSGIVAAVTDNNRGIAGTCWGCRIMAVRIGFADPAGRAWLEADDAADAIAYAVDNGAHILNLSWGRERTDLIEDAVGYAAAAGVVLIAAAGNDGTDMPRYPAAHDPVIAVAATDQGDARAYFSNHGSLIDVAAPGTDIYSTVPPGFYFSLSGTSMACPHVSGVAGLMLSKTPTLTPPEVRTLLRSTADEVDGTEYFGLGRINALAAVSPDTTPVADLAVPFESETIMGPVEIVGTAAGTGFVSYGLHRGQGTYPATWNELVSSSFPVEGAVLGTWDTRLEPDDLYTIRLVVTDDTGRPSEDRFLVTTDNMWVTTPTDYAIVRHGETLEIRGNATGPAFLHYDVAWGLGEDPTEWHTTGLSLVDGGQQGVSDGLLATWSTGVAPQDSIVSLLFTGSFVDFQEAVHVRGIRLDSMLEPGWPRTTGQQVFSSPMLESLDGSNEMQIVTLGRDGGVDVRRADGSPLPGWPADSLGAWQWEHNSTPALADLDDDGLAEIVVASFDNELCVFEPDGSPRPGWPQSPAGVARLYNSPTVADLDGDGVAEILQRADSHLLVFDPDGNETARWPRSAGDSSDAVADVDGDGDLEIAVTEEGGRISLLHHDGTDVPGWPQAVVGQIAYGGPVIGDLDGDGTLEIGVMARDGLLWVFDANGTLWPGWPVQAGYQSRSRPALADVDGDRALEMIVSSIIPAGIYAVRSDGTNVPGWPKTAPTVWPVEVGWSPAAVGDVDGDHSPEVFAVSEATSGYGITHPSRIHAWHSDGTPLGGWPKTLPANGSHSAPALGDVDADGRLELVVTVESGETYVFDLSGSDAATDPQWGMLHHDSAHTSASPFTPYEICDDRTDNDYDGLEDCEDLLTCAGLPCDDGNACTEPDVCAADLCLGPPVSCGDGLFCNGTEACDPTDGCGPGADPCPDRPCSEAEDACVGPPWWNDAWSFRKRLEVQDPAVDYQMPVTVYDEDGHDDVGHGIVDCEGRCEDDFSDLRFVSDGRILPHWLQSIDESGFARIWVRTRGSGDVYVYYGNANAFPASDGHATFLFFDDFSSDSLTPGSETEPFITAARDIPAIDAGQSFEAITKLHAVAGHDAVSSLAEIYDLELHQGPDGGKSYANGFHSDVGRYHVVRVNDGSESHEATSGYGYLDGSDYTIALIRDNSLDEVRGSVYDYGARFAGLPPSNTEIVAYPDDTYEFAVDRYRIRAGAGSSHDDAYIVYDAVGDYYELSGDANAGEVKERVYWVFVKRWRSPEPSWSMVGEGEFFEDVSVSCCEYDPYGSCDSADVVVDCAGWVAGRCCGDENANGIDDGCEVILLRVGRADVAWTSRLGAIGYDVVRGDLGVLRGTSGDFGAATEECVADDHSGTSLPFAVDPTVGAGFWFLVRGVGPAGNMTYAPPGECGLGSRDDGIALSPDACP